MSSQAAPAWATTDRDPIAPWTCGNAALLGDAALPMLPMLPMLQTLPTLQYLTQGGCMATEAALRLGEALRVHDGEIDKAFAHRPLHTGLCT